MRLHDNPKDALMGIGIDVVDAIRKAVRTLLEEKHLYQSIEVPVDTHVAKHTVKNEHQWPAMDLVTSRIANWDWHATDTRDAHPYTASSTTLTWTPPDAKVYCPSCKRVEAFNLSSCLNLLNTDGYVRDQAEQAYAISYQCQSCKGVPQTFLVRRIGARMTLSGRIPMEQVVVPKAIPQAVASYYSGAVVAHQSGQTLAGLFMLRTLCEQWARMYSVDPHADKAITAYMDSLPDDFKSRFPSLRKIYEDLSERLHAAKPDTTLFASVVDDLNLHFDARALFRLEPPAPAVTKGKA